MDSSSSTHIVDFKLLSKQLRKYGKIIPICDCFTLDETSFNQKLIVKCRL